MKIVFLDIDNLKNPHWGSGQARATREIGKRLIQKGNSVTVFCSKYPKYKDYEEEGIVYKHIGLALSNPQLNNLFYLISLPLTVRNINADVAIEHFTAPISTCFSPLFTKIPIIGLSSFFASEKMRKKYKINFSLIEKLGAKFYNYFIALNKTHQIKMKNLNSSIISTVIPNGVDKTYLEYKTKEKNYILYIGRIDIYHKGLDLLIKAFSDAAKIIEDDLYIIGGGSISEEKALKELIKEHDLGKRVRIIGKKSGSAKNNYFKNAKFTVFPFRFEGQSLSILESMALGKPIVCFDIPEMEWIKKKASIKVKPFQIDGLAKAIVDISTNRKKRLEMSVYERKEATKYTWDDTATKYDSFLKRVVGMSKKLKPFPS
ncbi:MAG: glycosyltransferase family 4 protein [Patescibacteria group bacterium]|nr:glycosyltransferase family 4 protein [Patescibacteria group bacterium]